MATQGSGTEIMELVTQMQNTIQQTFLPTMQELHSDFLKETQRVTDWVNDLSAAIKEAKPQIHEGFEAAVAALQHTETEIKKDVDDCTQAVNAFNSHVSESQGHMQELLGTTTGHASEVMDKLHTADELHQNAHDQISHELGDWTGHVHDVMQQLDEHHTQITSSLQAYHENADHHFTDLMSKYGAAGELVNQHVGQASDHHNTSVGEFLASNQDLSHSIGEELGGHVMDLIGDSDGFISTAADLGHTFDGSLGDILHTIEGISNLLKEIEPVIDAARALE
jgi:methyl-accepting chemotaxis protein